MAAAIGIAKTATEIFLGVGEVSIDNLTFKLHYRYTVTLLVAASVLVQTSQFFGDPVQCETVWYDLISNLINIFDLLLEYLLAQLVILFWIYFFENFNCNFYLPLRTFTNKIGYHVLNVIFWEFLLLNYLGVGEVSINNLTFKLHYRYSVTLLVAASVLVQTSQFFGDPVQCETVWYDLISNLMNNLTILRNPCTQRFF